MDIDRALLIDLTYELKRRAINPRKEIVEKVLLKLNIHNSKELVAYYGWNNKNIYNKFMDDYTMEIFFLHSK